MIFTFKKVIIFFKNLYRTYSKNRVKFFIIGFLVMVRNNEIHYIF